VLVIWLTAKWAIEYLPEQWHEIFCKLWSLMRPVVESHIPLERSERFIEFAEAEIQ